MQVTAEDVLTVLAPIVREHEGLRLEAYLDPVGKLTIGYGHTKTVTPKQKITKEHAELLLRRDMAEAVAATLHECPALSECSAEQIAAIADFTFNLGAGRLRASTLRKRINERQWDKVCSELRRWIYGTYVDKHGIERVEPLPGLIKRREAECTLWSSHGGTGSRPAAGAGV